MTSVNFCYWLQSAFELCDAKEFNAEQVKMIKNHLALVFAHEIDPSQDKGDPKKKEELSEIHQGLTKKESGLIRC